MNLNQKNHVPTAWPGRVTAFCFIVGFLLCVPLASRASGTVSFTNSTPIIIVDGFPQNPDGSPAPSISTINISSLGSVQSMTVTIYGLTEAATSPIELLLQNPSGQGIALMSDAGTGGASAINLTFSDTGALFPSATLSTGTFKPSGTAFGNSNSFPSTSPFYQEDTTNLLAGTIATNLNGTWTLSEYFDNFTGQDGTISGGWSLSFNVLTAAPAVTTLAASGITATSATLNATVNPNGNATQVFYQYGLSTSYGQFSAATNLSANLQSPQSAAVNLPVQPGITYHYRAVAINSFGTTYGSDLTFTTPAAQFNVGVSLVNNTSVALSIVQGSAGNYVIQGTSTLNAPITWTPIVTNTFTNGQPIYVAPTAGASEFYQVELH